MLFDRIEMLFYIFPMKKQVIVSLFIILFVLLIYISYNHFNIEISLIFFMAGLIAGGIFIFDKYSKLHSKLEGIEKKVIDKIKTENVDLFYQFQSYIYLQDLIKPQLPFPKMRGWAASPDYLSIITEIIIDKKPMKIVEAGSGVSTLVMAHVLASFNDLNGSIISLDHEEKYARKTVEMLEKHNLKKNVNVYHCGIKKYEFRGDDFLWYDMKTVKNIENIDLLIIDGPPALDWFDGEIKKYSRYGALPLLHEKLNEGAVILLDDASRKREKAIVDDWIFLFDDLQAEYIDTEKGACLIKKINIK